jgi:predicted nucleotidyltransferase
MPAQTAGRRAKGKNLSVRYRSLRFWGYHVATMRRADVLRTLAEHRDELRRLGVKTLSVFGSVARDEATAGSDIDVLVEFDRPVGYFHLFDVRERLEALLEARVDVVTPGGLRPEIRDAVLAEAVRAA